VGDDRFSQAPSGPETANCQSRPVTSRKFVITNDYQYHIKEQDSKIKEMDIERDIREAGNAVAGYQDIAIG
jgi:hypothetical protein